MQSKLLLLYSVFITTACAQTPQSIGTNIADKQKKPEDTLECSNFKFKDANQRADTLKKYAMVDDPVAVERFFCAFPNSFKEMEDLFGFSEKNRGAPLYNYEDGAAILEYFKNLTTIPKADYYNKYINICVGGVWEADHIVHAFDFEDKLINDTHVACTELSKRTDEDIASVFRFIFDGPHPQNLRSKVIYKRLLPRLNSYSARLGKLLTRSYKQVMRTTHGH
jgi:hypothetical protein